MTDVSVILTINIKDVKDNNVQSMAFQQQMDWGRAGLLAAVSDYMPAVAGEVAVIQRTKFGTAVWSAGTSGNHLHVIMQCRLTSSEKPQDEAALLHRVLTHELHGWAKYEKAAA